MGSASLIGHPRTTSQPHSLTPPPLFPFLSILHFRNLLRQLPLEQSSAMLRTVCPVTMKLRHIASSIFKGPGSIPWSQRRVKDLKFTVYPRLPKP